MSYVPLSRLSNPQEILVMSDLLQWLNDTGFAAYEGPTLANDTPPSRPPSVDRRRTVALPAENEPYQVFESIMHSMIAIPSPPITYDIRFPPTSLTIPIGSMLVGTLFEPALTSEAEHMRLVSPDFPWIVEVFGIAGRPVTGSDILFALYENLQSPLNQTDWQLADSVKRSSIERAFKRANPPRTGHRRVDWLGSRTRFVGLQKDERLASSILRLGIEEVQDTWAVKFAPVADVSH